MKKLLFIWALALIYSGSLPAQNVKTGKDTLLPAMDSLKNQSLQQAESLLVQESQQQKIDSIVKAELRQELQKINLNVQKQKDLEDQLKRIEESDSLKKAQRLKRIEDLKGNSPGFPVAPFGDTLFSINTRIGSFKPAERASAVSRRIKALADSERFSPDSLLVVQSESSSDIVYGELVVMAVTDLDALWYSRSRDDLAGEYAAKIRTAVTAQQKTNSILGWLIRIGLVLAILLGAAGIFYLVNLVFNRTRAYLRSNKERYFKGLSIKNINILTPEQNLKMALVANNLLRLLVLFFTFYLALPLLFGIFPETRAWAAVLWRLVANPAGSIALGIWNYLPKLFTVIVIIWVARYAVKLLKFLSLQIARGTLVIKGFYPEWAQPTFAIVRFLLYAFVFVVIFPYLPGSDSPIFKGVSLFLGVLFSLGSSSAIANVIAGLVITYMRPFKIGDRIKLGEVTGDVIDKTFLVTRIRTIKNEEITVPNSTVMSNYTVNYSTSSRDLGLILNTTVTIGYDAPWQKVHELLIAAAKETEGILKDKEPFVLQISLDDFFVTYQLNAYTDQAQAMAAIYSRLHQNIQDKFSQAGVEIVSPHYRAMRDGNKPAMPQ
ncbi:MAG: mechanosensitive ion channel family protein [Candidatus Edwardsbacteria bacterium]|nr:mechanosensitive ion channel family protein [Candidatus Edwardsbacteria bacterium]MBU1576002.1 mechanosensitive ion channel family protein [Candidatus Edwardsbacteria bacterium]MBU2462581.1 mechanosensitive ion channel family protein [Candidatus Edwardsbacteria bacterium]MBU2593724.1 mechanosensitive ion channel family protein [Candidatus Edwardsbacteria bacterium]